MEIQVFGETLCIEIRVSGGDPLYRDAGLWGAFVYVCI